jgi:hypothetical protein
MTGDHSIDAAAAAGFPPIEGSAIFLSPGQVAAAARYLASHWAKVVG